jgi:hypothetical protein
MSPSLAITCPVSIRIVVDLPAPFGPSRPRQMPLGTSRSSPSTAVISPKRLTAPAMEIAALSWGSVEGMGSVKRVIEPEDRRSRPN